MFSLSYSLVPKIALFIHILNILGSFLNTKALICIYIKLAVWARGVFILVYFYLTEAVLMDKYPHCGMCEAWCCWCSRCYSPSGLCLSLAAGIFHTLIKLTQTFQFEEKIPHTTNSCTLLGFYLTTVISIKAIMCKV